MILKKLFGKFRNTKSIFPESKHIIEYAFTCGGVDYFQHNDVFNIPYERGMMALIAYEECRSGMNREYLQKHVEAIDAILRSPNIDVFKINTLNQLLKEKMTFNVDADLLYKLAAVVFFDKNENPALYEPSYCAKKIEHWKKHKETVAFFLQMPMKELIPFLNTSKEALQASIKVRTEMNRMHSGLARQSGLSE